MNIYPYLDFDGRCEAAFDYYRQHLGGRIDVVMTYAQSPMADQVKADWANKVVHASIRIGDSTLMGADAPPGRFEKHQGIGLILQLEDPDEAERVFSALADGGDVRMPLEKTFWARRFGEVVDRFGVPWKINCE